MEALQTRLKSLKVLTGADEHFDIGDVPGTPQAMFQRWLGDAIAAGVAEPQVMTLSTVDRDGTPDARSVVLLDVDERGWHFAANALSPKGRQLAKQPQAALTVYWAGSARQVRLRGAVSAVGREESAADFNGRPEKSRAAILAARQSEVLEHPSDLERAVGEQLARLAAQPDLVSPHWTLFALAPQDAEFWHSNGSRKFTRLRYRQHGQQWTRQQLWP